MVNAQTDFVTTNWMLIKADNILIYITCILVFKTKTFVGKLIGLNDLYHLPLLILRLL